MNDIRTLLEVEIAGIRMKNPVMTASGTFGYGSEYADFIDLNKLGAIVVKGYHELCRGGEIRCRESLRHHRGCSTRSGCKTLALIAFIDKKLALPLQFRCPR